MKDVVDAHPNRSTPIGRLARFRPGPVAYSHLEILSAMAKADAEWLARRGRLALADIV
jgi:hypothetical protein